MDTESRTLAPWFRGMTGAKVQHCAGYFFISVLQLEKNICDILG